MDKLVREIGVVGDFKLWYVSQCTNLSGGLRLLKTDKDVIRFINEYKNEVGVEFYVETSDVEGIDNRYESDVEEIVVVDKGKCLAEVDDDYEPDPEYIGGEEEEEQSESEYGSVDGVSIDDIDYDEDWEWTSVLPNRNLNPTHVSELANSGKNLVGVESSRNSGVISLLDLEDENGESNYLASFESSKEDTDKKKLCRFKLFGNDELWERSYIYNCWVSKKLCQGICSTQQQEECLPQVEWEEKNCGEVLERLSISYKI